MTQPFRPQVLEVDRDAVVEAHRRCYEKKAAIYERHRRTARLAYARDNDALLRASEEWQEQSDLIVSTEFDLVHFDAQIRKAEADGTSALGLRSTRDQVAGRNEQAKKDYPGALKRLETLHKAETEK